MSGLIQAQDLAFQLNNPNLVILDCRSDLADRTNALNLYQKGHIDGAIHMHLEDDLSGEIIPGKTGRHPLPDKLDFETVLRRTGISLTSKVVVYDQANSMFAARAWWLLKWAGLTEVKILDGGLAAWAKLGKPLSTETPNASPSNIVVEPNDHWVVSAENLIDEKQNRTLLDARALKRYRGEIEPLDKQAGHIPGAQNADFTKNLDSNLRFLAADKLQARYNSIKDQESICYCGSGVTACHTIFAMTEAGYPMPKLFPGSWSEWITSESRRIAVGTEGAVL